MNKMLRNMMPAMAIALSVCTAPVLFRTETLSAADLQTMTAVRAADHLTIDADGEAYYLQGDEKVTGKFSLEPNFLLGDVTGDNIVDASDAAEVLAAAAKLGTGQAIQPGETEETDAQFRLYADADENGVMDAADAAYILAYAAKMGVGAGVHPLGFAYYYADENGILQTGLIEAANGESYIAGEDYKLLTGWVEMDGNTYYLDAEGVMQKNAWISAGAGKTYWMGSDGTLTTNSWLETPEGVYYLGAKGLPVNGLQSIQEQGYYFVDEQLQTGWFTVNGRTYYAGENGVLTRGFAEIDGETYCFGEMFNMLTGWLTRTEGRYYLNESGVMQTGWQEIGGKTYYLNESGILQTGFVTLEGGTYYFDKNGAMYTGFQTIGGADYYFYPETGHMATGFVYLNEDDVYFFGEDGAKVTGWQMIGGEQYYFGTDGTMTTGFARVDGVLYEFDADGVCLGVYTGEMTDTDLMLNTALRSEQKRSIPVYDQQKGTGKEITEFTIKLKDEDIAIIEQFLAEHTSENDTLAEKLYIVHQWIHYNVDYAYAGTKWNTIVNKSYVDAIFNYRMGQCVQYNGAMASVLAYYGFDVYMVKGWTSPGTQHYWTEVELNGHTYMVETGNSGKNGDWWQYFFKQMD